jgi:hypothetical protein
MKVQFDNEGGTKYFYITDVSLTGSNTAISIYAGDDYSLASGTITNKFYSVVENPVGFPEWFNWNPTLSASGSMVYTETVRYNSEFKLAGKECIFKLHTRGDTTGISSTEIRASFPVPMAVPFDSGGSIACTAYGIDPGVVSLVGLVSHTIGLRMYRIGGWAIGVDRQASISGSYEIE